MLGVAALIVDIILRSSAGLSQLFQLTAPDGDQNTKGRSQIVVLDTAI
jgi:hypothetical protein